MQQPARSRTRFLPRSATTFVTLAIGVVALTAASLGSAAAAAPHVPAAGSCTALEAPGADVAYRYASHTNAWRVRPVAVGIVARVFPTVKSRPAGSLLTETVHSDSEAWYLALDARQVGDACWIRVRLPATPNNRTGWVLRDELIAERTRWQVEVDLSERRVRVFDGVRLRQTVRAVVGKSSTPTPPSPTGAPFALYDMLAGSASSFTGTWQLATTAYSPVSETLGRIGLHGRGGRSLQDPLGTARSHGCVRISNSSINTMVALIGTDSLMGVPFVIHA